MPLLPLPLPLPKLLYHYCRAKLCEMVLARKEWGIFHALLRLLLTSGSSNTTAIATAADTATAVGKSISR